MCLWGCLFGGVGPLASVPAAAAAVDAAAPPVVENVATEPGSVETQGELPWRITADKMVSLNDGVIVEASGNVVLERGDDTLQADFARYFTTTDWVFVQQHRRKGKCPRPTVKK